VPAPTKIRGEETTGSEVKRELLNIIDIIDTGSLDPGREPPIATTAWR
jgi:hypothetical protein